MKNKSFRLPITPEIGQRAGPYTNIFNCLVGTAVHERFPEACVIVGPRDVQIDDVCYSISKSLYDFIHTAYSSEGMDGHPVVKKARTFVMKPL